LLERGEIKVKKMLMVQPIITNLTSFAAFRAAFGVCAALIANRFFHTRPNFASFSKPLTAFRRPQISSGPQLAPKFVTAMFGQSLFARLYNFVRN
jgi:hypothetical protein